MSECKRRAAIPESRRLLWMRLKRDAISLPSPEEIPRVVMLY